MIPVAVFIDTSAMFAFLDADDEHHAAAAETWRRLDHDTATLVTHNYVLIEAAALIQRRLGGEALRDFMEAVVPLLAVVWIGRDLHQAAAAALLMSGRRRVSLVDCASFEVMRRAGIREFFAFDPHFNEMGFAPFER